MVAPAQRECRMRNTKIVATMNKDAIIKLVNEQMWPKTDASHRQDRGQQDRCRTPRTHLLPARPDRQEGPHQGEAHDPHGEEIIPRSERENRMSEKASCFFASERSAEPTGDVRERCRRSFQRIVFSLEPGQSRLVAAFDQTVQGCDLLRSESQAGDDFGRQPGWFCKGQNENSKRDKRDETIVK